jgi:putative ABC transport system permease protein
MLMLKNYWKTALRFLLKNKTFSLINIVGLAAGTLCCLYILLYVIDQYSYDKHHTDAQDIYRLTTTMGLPGDKHVVSAATSPPIAPAIKRDFSQVVQFTRFVPTDGFGVKQHLLTYKNRSFYETDAAYADSTFFDVFSFHFVEGSPHTALQEPYSVVLMAPVAEKLFGSQDPIGKVINIDDNFDKHDFKVTGVVDERLGKSHLHANIFMAMHSGGMGGYTYRSNSWAGNNYAFSYVRMQPHTDVATLERQLPAFIEKYGGQQLKNLGMQKEIHLQPVGAIHTTAGYEHDKPVSSTFLSLLLLIAALIQVIACVNFMNLSTARASQRAKEVGVRKVVGAEKSDLFRQFLGEGILMSSLAVLIALPLLVMLLPYLNQITQSDINLSFFLDYRIWLLLTGMVLVTGLAAGSYPAFYLSAFQAIRVIKGNFTNQVSAAGIRRALVVFQFVLSITLITGIIVIYAQLNYVKTMDLGFSPDQKLIFSFYTDDVQPHISSFTQDLRQLAEVRTVSRANNYLSRFVPNDWPYYLAGGNASTAQDVKQIYTDEFFVRANGIRILKGRDFHDNDSGEVLINETLAKRLGLTVDKAPGTLLYPVTEPGDTVPPYTIAGVMKDFNYNSLHDEVKPFMLAYNVKRDDRTHLTVSTSSHDYKALLGQMRVLWNKNFPSIPFEYSFLDEEVDKQYATETTLSNIINSFTLMAVLISCLGLFGLAAFSAEQRNKEIGIRKVLGANVASIVRLLSREFVWLVGVSLLLSVPIGWWATHKWLQGFAYQVPLSWWMFALAGALAIGIALVTVSFQAIRAAVANPIRSLRSE